MRTLSSTGGRVVLALLLAAAGVVGWRGLGGDERTVTVQFPSAAALYVGNPVEVLGVPVGSVQEITPTGDVVEVVLEIDDDVDLPAEVFALQVAPSLISGRSITLAPAYSGGPRLEDGAVIPLERAQVPLDVNDLYTSAQDVSEALGPDGANEDGALSRALDVLAANLDGNGDSFAAAVRGLADATGVLSDNRGELAGTVRGLRTFVTTLAEEDPSVRRLNTQLATVSGFLAADRRDLRAALQQLSTSLGEVATFVDQNRAAVRANVTRLSRVTAVLVRNRRALGRALDEAPTGLGNLYNAYNAQGGTLDVRLDVNELALGPGAVLCEFISRGSPIDVPASLTQACAAIDDAAGDVGVPSLAELLAMLQEGAPGLPVSRGGAR